MAHTNREVLTLHMQALSDMTQPLGAGLMHMAVLLDLMAELNGDPASTAIVIPGAETEDGRVLWLAIARRDDYQVLADAAGLKAGIHMTRDGEVHPGDVPTEVLNGAH